MNGKIFAGVVLGVGVLCFAAFALFSKPQQPPPPANPPLVAAAETLVRSHSPVKGSPSAPVTIVEFLDPECEACRQMHPIVKTLLDEYPNKVRLVVRYMPLHGNSVFAASVLEEARDFGKYDEALDTLFENQPAWGDHHAPKPELIPTFLAPLGLDPSKLGPDYVIAKHGWKIQTDKADGVALGVRGTPTFFINGVMLPVSDLGYQPMKRAIDKALESGAG
jgi:protein-disulfide isomerase